MHEHAHPAEEVAAVYQQSCGLQCLRRRICISATQIGLRLHGMAGQPASLRRTHACCTQSPCLTHTPCEYGWTHTLVIGIDARGRPYLEKCSTHPPHRTGVLVLWQHAHRVHNASVQSTGRTETCQTNRSRHATTQQLPGPQGDEPQGRAGRRGTTSGQGALQGLCCLIPRGFMRQCAPPQSAVPRCAGTPPAGRFPGRQTPDQRRTTAVVAALRTVRTLKVQRANRGGQDAANDLQRGGDGQGAHVTHMHVCRMCICMRACVCVGVCVGWGGGASTIAYASSCWAAPTRCASAPQCSRLPRQQQGRSQEGRGRRAGGRAVMPATWPLRARPLAGRPAL